MTEQDGDPEDLRRVSRRYRALGPEEPPGALDQAILAAARREVGARPGARGRAAPPRWAGSLAAAAVLVLAVAVTLHMQSEQPDIAQPVPAAKQAAAPSAKQPAAPIASAPADAARPARSKAAEPPRTSVPEPFPAKTERAADIPRPAAPQAAAPAPAAAPSAELSSRGDDSRAPAAGAAVQAQALARGAGAQGNLQAETPERELERIAELRRRGRHDEADKALAEFRKRYPEFRIADEMRARVERR